MNFFQAKDHRDRVCECEECGKLTERQDNQDLCDECYDHFHCSDCGRRLEDMYGSPGDGMCRACD